MVGADLGGMIWGSEGIRSLGKGDAGLELIQDGTQVRGRGGIGSVFPGNREDIKREGELISAVLMSTCACSLCIIDISALELHFACLCCCV